MKTCSDKNSYKNIGCALNNGLQQAKVLYHITGYKDSLQFMWLFLAIYNKQDLFIIHVDEKSPEKIHQEFRRCTGFQQNVTFLPSQPVVWGGNGLIDVEGQAIKYGLKNDPEWTHFVNLSAQDYPLIAPDEIRNRLKQSWPSNYVLCNDIRGVHWRIRKRRLFRYMKIGGQRTFTPVPKFKPRGLEIRWVGPWWHILTRDFCSWLVSSDKPKRYLAFLRSAGMPDEMLIQNTIMDSPFRDHHISCCKHEIIWRRPDESISASARPSILLVDDLPRLEASEAFFARKFDHSVDHEVLTALAERNQFAQPSGAEFLNSEPLPASRTATLEF